MKWQYSLITSAILLTPATFVAAQEHGDVSPRVAAGKLITDEYVDGEGTLTPDVRVFGYDFQESLEDPYAINDPGFNALAGSGLPVGSRLGVAPVALPLSAFGGTTGLAYWDGVTTAPGGDPVFGSAPQGETLTLNFLSQNRTFASGGAVPAGFLFGPNVSAGGLFHEHLNSILNDGPGASPTPFDGVYVIALQLYSSDPSITASEPAYFVYNNGLSEAQHDVAIDFVQAVAVPEPASLALLGVAGIAALRRRRCVAI